MQNEQQHGLEWELLKYQQKSLKKERLFFAVSVIILVATIIATNAIWVLYI